MAMIPPPLLGDKPNRRDLPMRFRNTGSPTNSAKRKRASVHPVHSVHSGASALRQPRHSCTSAPRTSTLNAQGVFATVSKCKCQKAGSNTSLVQWYPAV